LSGEKNTRKVYALRVFGFQAFWERGQLARIFRSGKPYLDIKRLIQAAGWAIEVVGINACLKNHWLLFRQAFL